MLKIGSVGFLFTVMCAYAKGSSTAHIMWVWLVINSTTILHVGVQFVVNFKDTAIYNTS